MKFKPAIWYPIAVVLSVVNLAAVWFAARPAEPLHATGHAALALAFGLWAERLRQRREHAAIADHPDPLALEVDDMRRELSEAQERLDFAERMIAQERRPNPPRAD